MRSIYPVLERLALQGLNVQGVAAADDRAEELLPGCRCMVVVGSGGRALWEDFQAALREDPRRLTGQDQPLEAHVQRIIEQADPSPVSRRWLYASDPGVPMQELALKAGLGVRGRLWLIMHPEFGPWMALRAVCLTTEELPVTGPSAEPGPCVGCPAPCVSACPGSALSVGELDWDRCVAQQAVHGRCAPHCHSRRACPEGLQHAYGELQQRYHADPRSGRPLLATRLGITGDRRAPEGPFADVLRSFRKETRDD